MSWPRTIGYTRDGGSWIDEGSESSQDGSNGVERDDFARSLVRVFGKSRGVIAGATTEKDPTMWTTAMGERIAISDMEDSHLMNCIGVIYKRFFREDSKDCIPVLVTLDAERRKRNLFATPTHEAILRLITLPDADREVATDFILQLSPPHPPPPPPPHPPQPKTRKKKR